ncbi:unnamed protein product [Ilex paraguariensis]|uniref:RING-type domain-containing protein n=1 Tax=Ilex paraguariensis TaxID=185542 RepID=A0ABC8V2W8_9AQUA
MMRNTEVHDQSFNGRIPAEIAENLKEFFPEHGGDLTYEEILLHQESVYESLQASGKNKGISSDSGQTSDRSQVSGQDGESSRGGSVESQLALDEALARSLQELGEDFDDFYISEHSGTAAGSTELSPRETLVRTVSHHRRDDDVDPDNMTYEQLQSLGETVGSESRGLSEELISRLPTFKYKTGFFSRKKKMENEECVICCMAYKNGVRLTTLPCAHQYHSACIRRWLKLNKICPVCQGEVRGD